MNKKQLIESLKLRGFPEHILKAFNEVDRADFIPAELERYAWDDTSLPIGEGQTISQPYTIAKMLELLNIKKGQKILEVGSGCGYVLALLSNITGEKGLVFGVERIKKLADKSRKNLEFFKNIKVYHREGSKGLEEKAPFDRIIISAACYQIPEKLKSQLKDNGIIVAPVGSRYEQSLVAIKKEKGRFVTLDEIPGFVFVPFIEGD